MCHRSFLVLVLVLAVTAGARAQVNIVPTTTLAAETGSNTSEPPGFTSQTNGNIGGANVSKVNTRALLYPGYSGKIYAHVVGWFGDSHHLNIGYNSSDPAVVHRQVEDMISRGMDGVIHVWYGPGSNISNLEAQALMNEAQQHPGFQFAIMVDKGALEWNSCLPSCTVTQALLQETQYVAQTYFPSPAYLRINGRPVITNFDIDGAYSVDWNYVAANTPGNPIFLFQNNGGFTHSVTAGSYAWVMPDDANYGLNYLASFYNTGLKYPALLTVGATYKGFNDTLASWSADRIMSQQCGQTWLQTFAAINSLYNSGTQLGALQLVTWDDYEEGTEIETGIDNCFGISAAISGATLVWTISGDESTIDHYTVFISTDGQNLMPLGDFAAGTRQLDLSSFALRGGAYTLYVKAVGKPSIVNHMSGPATYSVGYTPPTAALALSSSGGVAPVTVSASTAASTDANLGGSITSSLINWGDGTASAGPNAAHTYNAAGAYTVTATVTDNYGLSASTTAAITVTPAMMSVSSPVNGATLAAPVHVVANAISGRPISAIIVYLDYNEAYRTYSAAVDTYLSMGAGSHLMVIKSWDNTGAVLQASLRFSVTGGPVAVLSVAMNGATATASTAASTDSVPITSSVINWGDGTQSPGPTATHTYSYPGPYTVTATVTDSLGLSASASRAVTAAGVVIWLPKAGSTVSGSQPVHIAATAYDSRKISAMIVYLDYNQVYLTYSSDFDYWMPMAKGSHLMVIKAWEDVTGKVYQSSIQFKVQ